MNLQMRPKSAKEVVREFARLQSRQEGIQKAMPVCPICGIRPILIEFYDEGFTNRRFLYQCKCDLALKACKSQAQAEREYYLAFKNTLKDAEYRRYLALSRRPNRS